MSASLVVVIMRCNIQKRKFARVSRLEPSFRITVFGIRECSCGIAMRTMLIPRAIIMLLDLTATPLAQGYCYACR